MTRMRAAAAFLTAGLVAAAAWPEIARAENPLAAYAWTARPLLVVGSADAPADPALARQVAAFAARQADLTDRAMPLIVVSGQSVTIDGAASDLSAAALRAHARIASEQTTVVLFGKDTGLKYKETAPVVPDAVFALIDRMPMRRREMREPR